MIYYLFWLFVYSFMGWLYESTLCSITGKKIVNRGFLNGPICPIYGCVAITVIFCLSSIQNVVVLFLSGMLLTCSIEYITSWLLEKIFKARWWDYSRYKFQINGRICLAGGIIFGGFSMVLLKWIHPHIESLTLKLDDMDLIILVILFVALGSGDCIITVIHVLKLNGKLKEIQIAMNEFLQGSYDKAKEFKETVHEGFENSKFYNERIKELVEDINIQERRLLKAFPKLKSLHYNEALEQFRYRGLRTLNKLKRMNKNR